MESSSDYAGPNFQSKFLVENYSGERDLEKGTETPILTTSNKGDGVTSHSTPQTPALAVEELQRDNGKLIKTSDTA